MGLKLALNPFRDPAYGVDWDEQAVKAKAELSAALAAYQETNLTFEIQEGDHGIGASDPRLILDILGLASLVFFGIPALHKKLRETIEEWKRIATELRKVVDWVAARLPITSHSMEFAFYETLLSLEKDVIVEDLILIQATEFLGLAESVNPDFNTVPLIYYLFIFQEGYERLHFIIIDSFLQVQVHKSVPLDLRFG